MIYTVNISNQAETDLRDIYEYIAYELQVPENANRQLDRLEKCILSLSQQPERFRAYDTEPWKSRGLRIVPVNNYCVFYMPNKETGIVTVIRVMYGGRDMETQLTRYTDENL
ncbi:MAG: type II toxin-antitoxin system RelE/ParE family toxin [Lachnospiraceae bacterium]|nr:type II toxin-antitoxin system RelE/ParE family toxin [Lachnospiraceae bacterium]